MDLTESGQLILAERYLLNGERPENMFERVAITVAAAEESFQTDIDKKIVIEKFTQMMENLEFLPNTPTLINAGKPNGQLAACFVLPLEDNIDKIFETLHHTALIHTYGGGTGFSFATIQPKSWPKNQEAYSLNICSILELFELATKLINQGGIRPGANMGILPINHPDIFDFVKYKSTVNSRLSSFNLSVSVTDEFMEKAIKNEKYQLEYSGKKGKLVSANELLFLIAQEAWASGEPGLIYADEINRANPTPEFGRIIATNPCGEQPLLPYEACNLGSINLVKIVANGKINWLKLQELVYWAVRFLDNVIEVNRLPLKESEEIVALNRKIGLGVMGFATMLQILNIPYNSDAAVKLGTDIMRFIQKHAHEASHSLAKERGSFPAINSSILKNEIRRNATCTTIAPTGSISSIAGVSSGIEPNFSLIYQRNILNKTVIEINRVFLKMIREAYPSHMAEEIIAYLMKFGKITDAPHLTKEKAAPYVTALEIDPAWHLKVQAAFQTYCDNAVAKTINLPENTKVEQIFDIFTMAYKLKCKGITVYRINSREKNALDFINCPIC
ncbi:MAG: adenosylcobalamin-dependent ribonucleoside-diphosphate reductase [Bacillota bacterium]|nr:adenosylcobalamin-dependent ribonucleoside-diphosphate reductase [Bacillota bacterium]